VFIYLNKKTKTDENLKMRHGTSGRRQRHRGNNGGHQGNNGRRPQQNRMQVFDSNGPDVRIRGTAHQVAEKYMVLAKDAASAGNRVLAESYLQHAEHYNRIIATFEEDVRDRTPQNFDAPRNYNEMIEDERPREEDLSLPSSILGAAPKAESQSAPAARTAEVTG
jgi:hypothetical protein